MIGRATRRGGERNAPARIGRRAGPGARPDGSTHRSHPAHGGRRGAEGRVECGCASREPRPLPPSPPPPPTRRPHPDQRSGMHPVTMEGRARVRACHRPTCRAPCRPAPADALRPVSIHPRLSHSPHVLLVRAPEPQKPTGCRVVCLESFRGGAGAGVRVARWRPSRRVRGPHPRRRMRPRWKTSDQGCRDAHPNPPPRISQAPRPRAQAQPPQDHECERGGDVVKEQRGEG